MAQWVVGWANFGGFDRLLRKVRRCSMRKSVALGPAQLCLDRSNRDSLLKRVAWACELGAWLNYVSTTSTTGCPALRLGSNLSRKSRYQRIDPAGTQMRTTVWRACVLTLAGTVSRWRMRFDPTSLRLIG